MTIAIHPYTADRIEAVRQFNERLRAAGEMVQFPLSPDPRWLPKIAGRKLFQEQYLAVDRSGAVRGGYILKHQDFWIRDAVASVGDFHLPISEGAIDRQFPQVGVQLLRDALRRQPLLYGLGIGGLEEPLSRLFRAAGWSAFSVPFFFRVVHPFNFLRKAAILRRRAVTALLCDLAAFTGIGWLGFRGLQSLSGCRRRSSTVTVELADEYSSWADDLWQACKGDYGMTAVRDAETLRILYPKDNRRFYRLKVLSAGRLIGWAVVLNTQLSDHKHFGNMRLGSLVDCFAAADDAPAVALAATSFLESQGVDLIVSNQSHAAWHRGLRQAGFLRGPSNFVFASSGRLTAVLRQKGIANDELHLNRGDGDGPINL